MTFDPEVSIREVLFPTLIRFRGDPDLAAAAKRERVTLSEFARRELRRAIVARSPHGRPDDDGPDPSYPAPAQRVAA